MGAHIWQRIKALFEQVIELPPESRAAYLDRQCADQPEVRREVEAMIAADATARHEHLSKMTAEKFPNYKLRLAETRAVCGVG